MKLANKKNKKYYNTVIKIEILYEWAELIEIDESALLVSF